MKVLMLTWEFPPLISGGLGMACYGLVKALLAAGVKIDMLLPAREDVLFELRSPADADTLPFRWLSPNQIMQERVSEASSVEERLQLIGALQHRLSYLSTGQRGPFPAVVGGLKGLGPAWVLEGLEEALRGDEEIFRAVREFTRSVLFHLPQGKYDLIHVHDWLTYPAGILLKAIFQKRLVAHIHATEFDRAGGTGDGRIHHIEYLGLTFADRVMAVSQYTAQKIMESYRIDPAKIRIVHNAHNVVKTPHEKKRLFKDPVILFLGRITLQKGPDYFLETAQKVLSRFPKVRFVMAGTGDMLHKIIEGAASGRLKDRFLFTGFLDREEVEEILSATDIYILPSVSEPFGIAPLEAMAYGAVAIISRNSGAAEVLKNAYKVDFWDIEKTADIIVDLLENPKKRKEIGKAGQEEVLMLEWDKAAQKIKEVYQEIACFT